MITVGYAIARLTKDQLHKLPLMKGDRPFWSDRPGRGGAAATRHALAACLTPGARPGAFPRKGGHPHTQGTACAHRSLFEQVALRHAGVALWSVCTAFCRSAWGSGFGPQAAPVPSSRRSGSGGKPILVSGGEEEKRTISERRAPAGARRSPIDISGACALALMRAQALFCEPGCRPAVMGCRP